MRIGEAWQQTQERSRESTSESGALPPPRPARLGGLRQRLKPLVDRLGQVPLQRWVDYFCIVGLIFIALGSAYIFIFG